MREGSVELNVEVEGEGRAVVWGHGMLCSMQLDEKVDLVQLDALSDAAKVLRYDARGHGLSEGSDNPEDYRWKPLAGDMLEVARAEGIDTFVAAGQSLGAATALYAALEAPERVEALVLVTPPAGWEQRNQQAELYSKLAQVVDLHGVKALVELLEEHRYFPQWLEDAQPSLREIYLKHFMLLDAGSMSNIIKGAGRSNLPRREELSKVNVPTLILAWSDDQSHPLQTAKTLDEALPNSRLVVAQSMDDLRLWPGLVKEFVAKAVR
jgi:pimeloyl-ACP methyl ester carboxylesterase